MTDIFISYAHEDRDIAQALAGEFSARGLEVWWDEDLRAGDDWASKIMGTLDTVRLVVTLWSPSSINSEWVSLEAGYALVKNKLVPAKVMPVETPSPFRSVQEADLTGWAQDRASDAADELTSCLIQRLALLRDGPTEPTVRRMLAQLRHDVRLGGRFIAAGLLTGVPLMILSGVLWAHVEAVVEFQIDPAMPANFTVSGSAQLMLTILTGVLGWTGWLFLRNAAKLQHRLEFSLGASKQQISDALSGSSLVSTSSAFVKILCLAFIFGSAITAVPTVAAISVSVLLRDPEYFNPSHLFLDVIVTLPFFLIAFVTQLRWFNPSRWDILPGPWRWYAIRRTQQGFDQLLFDPHIAHTLTADEVVTLRAALHEAAESIWSSLNAELATAHRRLRTIQFLHELFRGTLFESALSHVLSVELWKTADRALPDRSAEDQLQILLRFFS